MMKIAGIWVALMMIAMALVAASKMKIEEEDLASEKLQLAASKMKIYVREEDLASEEKLQGLYDRWHARYIKDRIRRRSHGDKARRFEHFKQNAHTVHEMNKRGGVPVEYHLNGFSDLSHEEYVVTYASCGDPHRVLPAVVPAAAAAYVATHDYGEDDNLPASVDWGKATGSVKDQGECGSCYAFAATGAMEAARYIEDNITITLSVQQLLDCTNGKGNFGCLGGWASTSFQYVIDNRGIDRDSEYPYMEQTGNCTDRLLGPSSDMGIYSYYNVEPRNEKVLMDAVAQRPVVALIVGSNSTEFKFYPGGMFNGPCGTTGMHEILIVGYGTTPTYDPQFPGTNYWLLKNSWGYEWGENGYMRMQRGYEADGGVCGIMLNTLYPANTYTPSS